MINGLEGEAAHRGATVAVRMAVGCLFIMLLGWSGSVRADNYPQPSPYPVSWQLDFTHSMPKRIVVQVPDKGAVPFYYMTYTVTNLTGQERMFLPKFVMVTREGKSIRDGKGIPAGVLEAIRQVERNPSLESTSQIAGRLRQGKDQAKDGVAIWVEPSARMGAFSIFIGGLSGEYVILKDSKGNPVKDAQGNPVILRKTLQLNYIIPGDEIYPGEDKINENPRRWVMR